MNDPRGAFVRKWCCRGVLEKDPFDRFFSFWIALVVATQRWSTNAGPSRPRQTDREKVIQYLLGHQAQALEVLNEIPTIRQLASRTGTTHHDAILDTGNRHLRKKFQRFARHFAGHKIPDNELVETLGEIINLVRNNVFHGNKIYDESDDIAVLDLVNPILETLIHRCEAREIFPHAKGLA